MRVQIQYRIRSERITTALSPDSDVFSDVAIHPIGGRTTGEYSFYSFAPTKAEDLGLYIAGDGSTDSQTNLATVDGYVYAIPMFLVYRRTPSSQTFLPTVINNGYTTESRSTDGWVKDRPDGVLIDKVYAEDIVDFRHQILTDSNDAKAVMERSLSKLIAGDLTTALKRGYDVDGQASSAVSGGSVLMKADRINSTGIDNIPNMGTGDEFKRAFCNAGLTLDHCVVYVPINGTDSGPWVAGSFPISGFFSKTYGSISSVDGIYSAGSTPLGALITGVTTTTSTITVAVGSNLIGTNATVYLEFTFQYIASDAGFKDVPRTLLEASKSPITPISLGDEVKVRYNSAGALLNFGIAPNSNYGDTTEDDYVVCKGGNYTENFNFGHDLVVYRVLSGTTLNISLDPTSGKLNGYYVLGVKRVKVKSGGVYGSPVSFTESRMVGSPYIITNYLLNVTAPAGSEVEVTLITGSKPSDDVGSAYDPAGSMKFFNVNRQGRGVVDTYEMLDVVAEETPHGSGNFVIDTSNIGKPIIAIGTQTSTSTYEVGVPIAFRHDTGAFFSITSPSGVNNFLPVLSSTNYQISLLPTRIVVSGASFGSPYKIRVPVLVHAAPTAAEKPYTFYYRMAPYQGILSASTEIKGKILAEGGSLITSLGSGAIQDYTYSTGKATFTQGERTIYADGNLSWLTYVHEGDYIRASGGKNYRIASVVDDETLILYEIFVDSSTYGTYVVTRKDVPSTGVSNVVDRMPSYYVTDSGGTYVTDYACDCDALKVGTYSGATGIEAVAYPLLTWGPTTRSQDPMASKANDFMIGSQVKTNTRGRYNFILSTSGSPAYRLYPDTPRAHIVYQDLYAPQTGGSRRKVYQAYLFARSAEDLVSGSTDVTGRLYMVVISGETCLDRQNLLTTFSAVDTVDVFELVGRPMIRVP